MTYDLLIPGVPAPQGSKSAVVRGTRAVLIEGASATGRAKHRAWRHAVAAAALEHVHTRGREPVPDGPLHVTLTFSMPKPRSKPKRVRWTSVKPDLDKLIRATLDGLADGGLLPHGDSRVVSVEATKRYAEPGMPTGCRVELEPVSEDAGDLARDLLGG